MLKTQKFLFGIIFVIMINLVFASSYYAAEPVKLKIEKLEKKVEEFKKLAEDRGKRLEQLKTF